MRPGQAFLEHITAQLDAIRAEGLWKTEREITGPQGTWVTAGEGRRMLNLCANNYLSLADDPRLIRVASAAMASVVSRATLAAAAAAAP